MNFFCLLAAGSLALPLSAGANSGAATVILLRGTASLNGGKPLQLKDEVSPGNTVKTSARSFVKLLFQDKSQVNVGPDTTLKLETTQAGEPSLVNLVGGQIRAKVTKDLLQEGSGSSADKLQIKTKTAAMGIRGTDFNVSFNQANNSTALITFEGNVAMAKIEGNESAAQALADSSQVQSVGPGQFSGTNPGQAQASVPVKISPAQLETLRRNENYEGMDKAAVKADALASPLPPGVDPKLFSSGAEQAMAESAGKPMENAAPSAIPPEGFFDAKTGAYAPRAGGFIDLATGLYVPPPPGSSFDPNTGVYLPPRAMGQFDAKSGMYVPPKGVALDAVKGFVPETRSQPGNSMTNLLNFAMRPELAGQQTSFEKLFTPSASGNTFAPPPNMQMPPLPGTMPPPNTLPPPPREPTDDPTCITCRPDKVLDNINTSAVNLQIKVDGL